MALDSFFNEIDSNLLLLLFLTTLTKEDEGAAGDKLEEGLEAGIAEPVLQAEPISYIRKSSNRKRLKPKAVYF